MKFRILSFLLLIPFLVLSSNAGKAPHPFYLSVVEIEHDAEEKTLQLTFKIFTDDLEKALENAGAPEIELGTEDEHEETDRYLGRYLQKHLQLEVDEQSVSFEFLGKEVETQKTWCYAEVKDVAKVEKLKVKCDLLTELFESQSNIIHTHIHGKEKSEKLNRDYSSEVFEY